MNSELLVTIGVGNLKSHMSIFLMQLFLYLITMDMTTPALGLIISIVMASFFAVVAITVLQFYNSESATKNGKTRYIRTFSEKSKLFIRVMLFSYGASLMTLIVLYVFDLGVASYFKVTAPASLLILLIIMSVHELSMNAKYSSLKNASWVFDYMKTPMIKTVSNTLKINIPMFNDKNQFVASETINPFKVDDIFTEIPPGTKLVSGTVKKPNFKVINFGFYFKYTSTMGFKHIYIKQETPDDNKLFNLYLDALSTYKGIYSINSSIMPCSKTTIMINKSTLENYIEQNDYIKQYVSSKDVDVGLISMRLNLKLAKLQVVDFLSRVGKKVNDYEIKKDNKKLFIIDLENNGTQEYDVSYLLQYMSLNLDEYRCKRDDKIVKKDEDSLNKTDQKYVSFHEKLSDIQVPLGDLSVQEEVEAETEKTLYRINIKGNIVYAFSEDFKTVSEIDEIIFNNFINKDLSYILGRMGYEQ